MWAPMASSKNNIAQGRRQGILKEIAIRVAFSSTDLYFISVIVAIFSASLKKTYIHVLSCILVLHFVIFSIPVALN